MWFRPLRCKLPGYVWLCACNQRGWHGKNCNELELLRGPYRCTDHPAASRSAPAGSQSPGPALPRRNIRHVPVPVPTCQRSPIKAPGGARICKAAGSLWQGFPASAASDENVGMNCPPSRDSVPHADQVDGGAQHTVPGWSARWSARWSALSMYTHRTGPQCQCR